MDDKIKAAMAIKNGKAEERYVEAVREEVSKEFTLADEVAILRKSVAYLFELIATIHEGEISNSEFVNYHNTIEQIKADKRLKDKMKYKLLSSSTEPEG